MGSEFMEIIKGARTVPVAGWSNAWPGGRFYNFYVQIWAICVRKRTTTSWGTGAGVRREIVLGKYCLRGCIVRFRTSEKDIEEIIAIIVREGSRLHKNFRAIDDENALNMQAG